MASFVSDSFDLLYITFRLDCGYGNHFSTIIDCGFGGSGGKRSTITCRPGGGNFLPDIVIVLLFISGGGDGGFSRMINGSGVCGLGGFWRIIMGGAGDFTLDNNNIIKKSQ